MSDEKGPTGGEKRVENLKKEEMAQVVGAADQLGENSNISKHADMDDFWSKRTSGERKSKLFGAHGVENTQKLKEEDMALNPNNEEASDEEMDYLCTRVRGYLMSTP